MKKIVITIISIISLMNLSAQQDAMFTHYSFNTSIVNPAYAGSRGVLSATGIFRAQWVGFPGAPMTQTLTVHAPLLKAKLGLGLSLINDKIGPTNQTAVYVDFAYRIKLGKKKRGKLAFGVKAGLNIINNSLADEITIEPDVTFVNNMKTKLLPNVGFGVYYATDKFYVGVSIPRLIETEYYSAVNSDLNLEERHYFLIAGTIFKLNKSGTLKMKPTMFLKVTHAAPIELDVTALIYIKDRFWVGPKYRTEHAVGLLGGLQIIPQLSTGYSFDWSFTNPTSQLNGGSHEVMLRYEFIKKKNNLIESPRYF